MTPLFSPVLDADEELALRHLEHYLGGHDRYFLSPAGLHPERPGFEVVHFPNDCFRSVESYSRLLLSSTFYRTFESYDFILIYQLDCLVFSDSLHAWCAAGFDYVGAPWLIDPLAPEKGFSRVGNGGLSLRRVKSCLAVLDSDRYVGEPAPWWRDILRAPLPDLSHPSRISALRKRIQVLREARRGVAWYTAHYGLNEDRFWSDRARLFLPKFRIAPVTEGLRFAFERSPRTCYAENGHELPFGCHAWARWDRRFWLPHLLTSEPAR